MTPELEAILLQRKRIENEIDMIFMGVHCYPVPETTIALKNIVRDLGCTYPEIERYILKKYKPFLKY